jgi:uncharacterized protein (TIGR04255 family)
LGKQYNLDFIKQVIIRIDFNSKIKDLENSLPEEIKTIIKEYFSIEEPRKLIGKEFLFSPKSIDLQARDTEKNEWRFYDKDREKVLALTDEFMYIACKKHEDFNILKIKFIKIATMILLQWPDIQIKRYGLRYINLLNGELDIKKPKGLRKYLNMHLMSLINFPIGQENISRALNHIEYNFGLNRLTFQSGFRNPDYPSPIKRNVFALDYDCYYEGETDSSDLEAYLEKAHDIIINFFEQSISKELRSYMESGKDKLK